MPSWFVPFIREFMGDQNAQFWTECGAKGKVTEHPGVWFLSPSRAKERSDPNPEAGAMLLARTGLYKPAQIKSTHIGLEGVGTYPLTLLHSHSLSHTHPSVWELACDPVVNRRVVLLGDAAHMSSPRTGAGAYTAMVDAVVLGQAFEKGAAPPALLETEKPWGLEGRHSKADPRRQQDWFLKRLQGG